jgi:outer membrane lipoprotein LolB
MPTRRAWAAAAATCTLLAACRTLPVAAPAAPAWPLRQSELQARAHFALKGRVAVATGDNGFNARLRWTQDGARSQLALEGPLGAGGVQIVSDGNDLEVLTANGAHVSSAAAREELSERLGFDPPVSSLRYWLLGVPDPAEPSTETLDEAQQRLASLEQDGWRIEYASYVAVGSEWLPSRLTLQREGVRVRLLVDGWQS